MESISRSVPPAFVGLGPAKDYVDDIHDLFTRIPILESLTVQETQLLCNFMVCFSAPRGTVIMRQGEMGEFMLFLLTGRAEVIKKDEFDVHHRLATAGPGAVIGEMSVIDSKARSTTLVALEPVDMVVLSRQGFRDMLISLPRLGNKLLLVLLHLVAEQLERNHQVLMKLTPGESFSEQSGFGDL